MRLSSLLAASTVAVVGCQAPSQTEDQASIEAAVVQTWTNFDRAWESGDLESIMELFTPDALNMPTYSHVQRGRDEIEAAFGSTFAGGRFDIIERTTTEVFGHADMAYEFGTLRQTYTPTGGEPATQELRYSTVFLRGEDGVWRFHRWMAQFAN